MGLKPLIAKKKRRSALDGLQSVKNGWRVWFRQGQTGLYPCPSCKDGRLSPDEATFHKQETRESVRNRPDEPDDAWVPVSRVYRFAGLLTCSAPFCREVVTISGRLDIATGMREVDNDYGQSDEEEYEENTYYPESLSPAPRIFSTPTNVPRQVAAELDRAFKLFWVDERACANSIRSAVELFMDHQKVPVTFRDGRGDRRSLSLHRRIEIWGERRGRDKLSKALMAIKFIGNEGSHRGITSGVTQDDIFDGFTLLKHVLDTVFSMESHARAVDVLARRIVKSRKPRSQHRAR